MTWLSSLLNTDESSFEIYFVTEIQTPYKNWRLVTCRFRTSRACLIFHLWRHLGSCRLRTHRVVLACSATTWHMPSIISQCCPSSTCRTCLPRQIKTSPRYYLFVVCRWGFPWCFTCYSLPISFARHDENGIFCIVFVAIRHFCHQLAGITRCPSFFLYSPRLLYRGSSITLFTLTVRCQYPDDKDVAESLGLSRQERIAV